MSHEEVETKRLQEFDQDPHNDSHDGEQPHAMANGDPDHHFPLSFSELFSMKSARYFWKETRTNWPAGVTVSLINVPLSISLAVASDATPIMGIISAIWAGLMSSLFGGSMFNIVGPTGALSGILSKYSIEFGVGVLPFLAIISGIGAFIIFALGWDRYVMFLPSSVDHGFTLGVAVIIAGNQLNSASGLFGLHRHREFRNNLFETFKHIDNVDPVAIIVTIVCFTALYTLSRKYRRIPWAIFLAMIGVLIGYLSFNGHSALKLRTLRDNYGMLEPEIVQVPTWDEKYSDMDALLSLIQASTSIMFVAVLETLISGKIADGMTNTVMDQRKEVLGVSLANIVCGMFGGIPSTAALARTALNIKSGATSRSGAIINTISTFIISMAVLPLFSYLPMPIIAAMLINVAVRMVDAKHIIRYWDYDRGQLILTLIVAFICVIEDPTMGIVVGTIVGLLRHTDQIAVGFSEISINTPTSQVNVPFHELDPKKPPAPKTFAGFFSGLVDYFLERHLNSSNSIRASESIVGMKELDSKDITAVYDVMGKLTYINAGKHAARLKKLTDCKRVVIRFTHCYYADLDGLDAIEESIQHLKKHDVDVFLCGISVYTEHLFHKMDWYHAKLAERKVLANLRDVAKAINVPVHRRQSNPSISLPRSHYSAGAAGAAAQTPNAPNAPPAPEDDA